MGHHSIPECSLPFPCLGLLLAPSHLWITLLPSSLQMLSSTCPQGPRLSLLCLRKSFLLNILITPQNFPLYTHDHCNELIIQLTNITLFRTLYSRWKVFSHNLTIHFLSGKISWGICPVGLEGSLLHSSLLIRRPLFEVFCQSPYLQEESVLMWILSLALGSQLGFITLINNRITSIHWVWWSILLHSSTLDHFLLSGYYRIL